MSDIINKWRYLPDMLEYKYGAIADTIGDKIVAWRHAELLEPSREQLDLDLDEYLIHLSAIEYRKSREVEYPQIGDQLDAILKQLNYDRLQGKDLTSEMDDILSKWLSVKAKYPKPE